MPKCFEEWHDDENTLTDQFVEFGRSLGIQAIKHVDLRRDPDGISDASMIVDADRVNLLRNKHILENAFAACEEIKSTHIGQNKIAVRFEDEFLAKVANRVSSQTESLFGLRTYLSGRYYILDFCDPNLTKSLHIGHLRNLALGHLLASILENMGASVCRQSVLGDIGRNVCEAMAGYIQFAGGRVPASEGLRGDVFIGNYYARFVKTISDDTMENSPDAPVSREIVVRSDLAQEILNQWRTGDDEIRSLWHRITTWVLDGQSDTLRNLGIKFDRLMYESDSLPLVEQWIRHGMDKQIFEQFANGAIAFPTGKDDYSHLLLVRTDGFPTEHMRAVPLWWNLQAEGARITACLHVMGDEWLPTTVLREKLLRSFGPCPLYDRYHKITHAMVTLRGSRMKSSKGDAVLIDDLFHELLRNDQLLRLAGDKEDPISIEVICRLIVFLFFLSVPTENVIEFSTDSLLDERRNPGMQIARAFIQTQKFEFHDFKSGDLSPEIRYIVLQSQRLKSFLIRAIETYDCYQLVRFLSRTAGWYLANEHNHETAFILNRILKAGLNSLGLLQTSKKK